jgi:hypothetical protein
MRAAFQGSNRRAGADPRHLPPEDRLDAPRAVRFRNPVTSPRTGTAKAVARSRRRGRDATVDPDVRVERASPAPQVLAGLPVRTETRKYLKGCDKFAGARCVDALVAAKSSSLNSFRAPKFTHELREFFPGSTTKRAAPERVAALREPDELLRELFSRQRESRARSFSWRGSSKIQSARSLNPSRALRVDGPALRVENLAFRIFPALCDARSCSSRRRPRVLILSRALRVDGPALRVENLAL